MDLVLKICDDYVLDKLWATVLPASAFTSSPGAAFLRSSLNGSSLPVLTAGSGKWSQLLSYIPHPPLLADELTPIAPSLASAWPRDYIPRQIISLFLLTWIGIHFLYFIFAWLSYKYIFNHEMMKHPRFLKDQVKLEIQLSLKAFPGMTALTLPWFMGEVRGYSKLYDNVDEYGWGYFAFSIVWFLVFTDFGIYWIHRWEHDPKWYKWLHKPHHKWVVPTPFASHAFHPLDGYLQSIPYHVFVFVFPLHRVLYLGLFVFVNFWTILIHDSDMITGHPLEKVINGPAHHTLHHLYFTVNYGQYFTWADRMGNSYRQPASELDPLKEVQEHLAKKEKHAPGKQH
ncbi:fatty acid hydroxylase [Daedalea quercina L-15889]|uniref:Fatty acid hydroxylase n=1 Tax=Daedalea quercina L-15889 TaxID=1314783 RepID=A0A165NUX6_9APHY|nr:fatty acid hydroxylase [Daedalea quercina L-15889]